MTDKSWAGLHKTAGMKYRNRMHERSFSVELFRVNADQLMTFLSSNSDVMEMMHGLNDLYSSHAVMREAARRLHNFLAGAMTLVDHTRVLISTHYTHTSVERTFNKGILVNFASNPMTRFVQDLRNYMIHRGMPPLVREMRMLPVPGGKLIQMQGEVNWHLAKSELLAFKNWKAEAKKYLNSAPNEIGVIAVIEVYQAAILKFHEDLDLVLEKYHEIDVAESTVYESELRLRSIPRGDGK